MTSDLRFARDSPLEESGFELMVPPRTERKWEGAGTHQHHLGRASELKVPLSLSFLISLRTRGIRSSILSLRRSVLCEPRAPGRPRPVRPARSANSIIDAPAPPTRPVYPGIGSPVPAKCPAGEHPAHRAEPEVRQRRGPVAASLLERTSECRIDEGSLSPSYLTTPPASR